MTPPPATLRSLRSSDTGPLLAQLGPVLAASYPGGQAALARLLARALRARAEAAVAIVPGGEVAGLALAQLKPRGVKLSCLWVAAEHRKQRIGARLVARVVDAFGARPIYVTFDSAHLPAMAAVLSPHGFALEARLPDRYSPGRCELVFRRPADPAPVLRSLSLTRPWTEQILAAGKDVENRSRRTSHRGLLVLHGAKSTTDLAAQFSGERRLPSPLPAARCPTGYLGVAHLVAVDCHDDECGSVCSPWAMPGSWHWRLAFATRFADPFPGRGHVALWHPGADVAAAVRAALG